MAGAGAQVQQSTPQNTSPAGGPARADVVLALGALAVFVAAFAASFEWSFRTALFPRIVTVAGALLTMAFLLSCGVAQVLASRRGAATQAPSDPAGVQLVDEDDAHDHEVEYVYATAGKAAWTQALAWVASFLLLLWIAGLFIAAAAFAFAYLRWGAARSWRFCAVYAVVLAGVLYLGLDVLLHVPVPDSLLG